MYTREAFNARPDGAKRRADRHARVLAIVAITGGLGQLLLLRWLESSFDVRVREAIAFGIFLIYIAIVTVLIVRRASHRGVNPPSATSFSRLIRARIALVKSATS